MSKRKINVLCTQIARVKSKSNVLKKICSIESTVGPTYEFSIGELQQDVGHMKSDQCRVSLYGRSGICRGPRASGAPRTGAT